MLERVPPVIDKACPVSSQILVRPKLDQLDQLDRLCQPCIAFSMNMKLHSLSFIPEPPVPKTETGTVGVKKNILSCWNENGIPVVLEGNGTFRFLQW